jgi:hypothetical protein
VHADSAAQRSAAEIGARAYTSGNHIVVGAGGDDQHTLAHELTHVIQQRSGTVAGTDHGDGLRISDPSDRFEREAEANATRALAEPPAPHAEDDAHHDAQHTTGAAAGGSSAAVQQAPAVQRAIGDIGEAAIGRLLRRQGRQAAGFKVNKAERTSTGWRYEVQDKNGFAPARWVDGTDDEFDLAEAPQVSAEEQAVQQQINALLQAAPSGGAQSLLDGRPAGEAAAMVGMGETQKAVGQMNVLWSGGASDCVIVAAVADGKGWISHVDRSGPSPATIINAVRQVGTGRVYLASQVFTKNDSAASELVRSIVKGLTDQGIAISAIFPSSSLGVNAGTGTVVANLSRTDIDILKGNEAI